MTPLFLIHELSPCTVQTALLEYFGTRFSLTSTVFQGILGVYMLWKNPRLSDS